MVIFEAVGDNEMSKFVSMREVTLEDFKEYAKNHDKIKIQDRIGGKPYEIELGKKHKIKKFHPDDFEFEGTNVWSYPKRGNWATHKGNFRGNWPPRLTRNIILRYSEKGDTVLDQMVGSGTTLIECKLLGRNGVGVDVNEKCIMLTLDRLNFHYNTLDYSTDEVSIKTYVGDARNLDLIDDNSIDLIATHPPYANIIPYSKETNSNDISAVRDICKYVKEIGKITRESFRVLKPGHYFAILIGDTRREKHHVPIAFPCMQKILEEGFVLKEDVMKHQWRCKATGYWLERSKKQNFLLLMYEHLFVLRKPEEGEDIKKLKESTKWW